jgi:D-alanine-D-alanine ligase
MKAVILHDQIPPDASSAHQDVLYQTKTVSNLLKELGYEPIEIGVSLNLPGLSETLTAMKPSLVFNLVESIEGKGRFIHLVPSLLDYLKLPYTGSKQIPLFNVNKIMLKMLIKAGV